MSSTDSEDVSSFDSEDEEARAAHAVECERQHAIAWSDLLDACADGAVASARYSAARARSCAEIAHQTVLSANHAFAVAEAARAEEKLAISEEVVAAAREELAAAIARAETEAAAEAARQRELREAEEDVDETDADTVVTTDSDERRFADDDLDAVLGPGWATRFGDPGAPVELLMEILQDRDVDVVRDLLAEGHDPDVIDGTCGWTPLIHLMVHDPDLDVAKLLIDAGADVNFKTSWPEVSPLRMASFSSIPATRLLLAAGATFKMTDYDDLRGRDFTARAYLTRVEAAGGFELYVESQYQKVLAVRLLTSDRGGRLPSALVPKVIGFWNRYGRYPAHRRAPA